MFNKTNVYKLQIRNKTLPTQLNLLWVPFPSPHSFLPLPNLNHTIWALGGEEESG